MTKEKATITLDRKKAEEARALVGAESTSAVVDVALDRQSATSGRGARETAEAGLR